MMLRLWILILSRLKCGEMNVERERLPSRQWKTSHSFSLRTVFNWNRFLGELGWKIFISALGSEIEWKNEKLKKDSGGNLIECHFLCFLFVVPQRIWPLGVVENHWHHEEQTSENFLIHLNYSFPGNILRSLRERFKKIEEFQEI